MSSYFLPAIFIFLFSGCNNKILNLQVDYISKENLASYHVETPDFRLIYPPSGQRMIVSWSIPKNYFSLHDIKIHVQVHFRNHTSDEFWITPKKFHGLYLYYLLNEEYFSKRGLLSYKAEVYSDGDIIENRQHHLWVNLITFPDSESEELYELEPEVRGPEVPGLDFPDA